MTDEEIMVDMKEDGKDADIYTEEGREVEMDSDAVDDVGAGFAQGYEEGEKLVKCAKCGKLLGKDVVEVEINGEVYNFCSEECAEKYETENK